MTIAAAVLAPAPATAPSALAAVVAAALESGADEAFVVVSSPALASAMPEPATVLLDAAKVPDEASGARVALDWAARAGHTGAVLGYGDLRRLAPTLTSDRAWAALVGAEAPVPPVLVGTRRRAPAGLVRLEAAAWSLLPLTGTLEVLWRSRPELKGEVALDGLARIA